MLNYEEAILEMWETSKPEKKQGQEIWNIAKRSNEKPGLFTRKKVDKYQRVGLL